MKRTSAARCGSVAVVARAVEHQRARGARRAVGAERDLVEQPHRHRAAAAGLEVEVQHLGLHFAGRGGERGQQRRAVARRRCRRASGRRSRPGPDRGRASRPAWR